MGVCFLENGVDVEGNGNVFQLIFYKDYIKQLEDLCVFLLISLVVYWRVGKLISIFCFVFYL